MATVQSTGHLENTLDRITVDIGKKSDRSLSVKMIESITADTPYENCINRCEIRLASSAPMMGRPFLRNDAPEFLATTFPLHHPGYLT
ncbi:MAG: hypothetical protein EOO80_00765 [Oxalobacteraceae bacterium]|nr:MAG: hypothetical protein EOO80_00765 [Oxalobacteraceae bacterium]